MRFVAAFSCVLALVNAALTLAGHHSLSGEVSGWIGAACWSFNCIWSRP